MTRERRPEGADPEPLAKKVGVHATGRPGQDRREPRIRLNEVLPRLSWARDTLDMMLAGHWDSTPELVDTLSSILQRAGEWEREARR